MTQVPHCNLGGYQHSILDDSDEEGEEEIIFGCFRASVVGIRYYRGHVNKNEMVSLRREPNNQYDRNAIRVDNVFGVQVGHIKREQAAVLAELVDKKLAKLEGVVPYGNNNKFCMPCDLFLHGSPKNAERCQDEMQMRGYPLKTVIDECHKKDPEVVYSPKKASKYSAVSSNRELIKIPQEKMMQELDNLFENFVKTDKQQMVDPSDAVKTNLFPHQKQALSWMIARENTDELPPFWKKEKNGYINLLTNFTSQTKPTNMLGGILADDMGVGKTLSIISLIMTNFLQGEPMVVVDKSVSVMVETGEVRNKRLKKRPSSSGKLKKVNSIVNAPVSRRFVANDEMLSHEEQEEDSSPSFDTKEDIDYTPVTERVVQATISSQRPRCSTKKARYNFDDDNWLIGNEIDSPEKLKRKSKLKTKMGITSEDKSDIGSDQAIREVLENTQPLTVESEEVASQLIEDVQSAVGYKITKTQSSGPRATLIVSPLSVLSNWEDQFRRHTESGAVDVYTYYGSNKIKDTDILSQKDVVLTTYQTLSSHFSKKTSPLLKTKWLRVVLDEGHCIRNSNSNQSKAAHALQAERRWVVTGTPIQNSLKDLFSVIGFLRIEPLSNKEWWNRTIQRPISNGDNNALKRLQSLISKIALRRTKTQTVNGKRIVQLPMKSIFIQKIELSKEERQLYDTFKNEGKSITDRYANDNTMLSHYAHVLVILMRLRQLCCHPKLCAQLLDLIGDMSSTATPDQLNEKLQQILSVLLSSGDEECPICLDSLNQPVITHCAHLYCRPCIESVIRSDARATAQCPICRGDIDKNKLVEPAAEANDHTDNKENTWSSSSKVDGLITLLHKEKAEDKDRKSLVVSQFSSFLNLLEKPLKESGFQFVRLDGSMTLHQRSESVNAFSSTAPNSPTIMLLSLKAGGVGVNLTAATRVFLMDPAWNPAAEDQCFDRCHRLGQTKDVHIYKFIIKDSVEERMLELQKQKRELMAGAFGKQISAKEKQKQRILDVQHLLS